VASCHYFNMYLLFMRSSVRDLFPDCTIKRERFLFMTKAYLIVRT
jgi:hypothetical protein